MMKRPILLMLWVFMALVAGVSDTSANGEIFPALPAANDAIHWKNGYFVINGKPTFITAGEMHYARIPRELWRDRIWRTKQMGFNCIQMYVFWNATEPKEGVWDFTDNLDLDAWLSLIQEMGMYAIVRVGPYSCAEWEHGGFPGWLTIKPGIQLRNQDPQYNRYADEHLAKVEAIVAKHQIHKGGNVLMVQLENEHPRGWGTDKEPHLMHLYEQARKAGLEIPLFFSGLHHGGDPSGESPYAKGASPWYSTEFWTGWIGRYGDMPPSMLNEKVRGTWKIIAFGGAGYDYYVVHGGSNFGYSGDSMEATYDYSSAIGEAGQFHNLYAPARRAAMFAQAFAGVLTASDNAPAFAKSANGQGRVTTRTSPAGTIVFADNFQQPADKKKASRQIAPTAAAYKAEAPVPGKGVITMKLAVEGQGEFPRDGSLVLYPHDLRTVVFNLPWTAACSFESIATGVLLREQIGGVETWVCYGAPGDHGEVTLKRSSKSGLPTKYAFTYPGKDEVQDVTVDSGDGHLVRLLVMNTKLADRTWLVKGKLMVGAAFVREDGSAEMPLEGGRLIVYGKDGRTETVCGKAEAGSLPGFSHWAWRPAAEERKPDYDDSKWLTSQDPQAMESYDSFQNRYGWYRTTLTSATNCKKRLRFIGQNGTLLAYLNGQPAELESLELKQGNNRLAIFSIIGPRPKLYAFTGPIGTGAARGIWGGMYNADKPLVNSGIWKLFRVPSKSTATDDFAKPDFDDHAWQTIPVANKKMELDEEGIYWLRTSFEMPEAVDGCLACLPDASKEDLRVFINEKAVKLIRMDKGAVNLTGFLKPGKNSIAIEFVTKTNKYVKKVWILPRLELWKAEPPSTWKFRGGLENLQETAVVGRVLNWREFIEKPWNEAEALANELPRFWKTTFKFGSTQREPVGLVTTGLNPGQVWFNGHNLGATPQKVPLYMPECWLKDGDNELVVFAAKGQKPAAVRLERYETRQVVRLP